MTRRPMTREQALRRKAVRANPPIVERAEAWAIIASFDWGEAVTGQFWFVSERPFPCTGYPLAVFRTRAEARRSKQGGMRNCGCAPFARDLVFGGMSRHSSRGSKRKAASAMIAKIPFRLARHVAAFWRPACEFHDAASRDSAEATR